MDYRIKNKGELKWLIHFRDFNERAHKKGIPALWDAYYEQKIGKEMSCYFGICAENGEEVF